MRIVTRSTEATQELGRRLGRRLGPGDFVALVGDLGAGKTTFAQGLLQGLGVGRPGGSPTFTILVEYEGRLPVYHFDVYRLRSPDELEDIGYADYFYGAGVAVVEWADRVRELWPAEYLLVELTLEPGGEHSLVFRAEGERCRRLVEGLDDAGPGA